MPSLVRIESTSERGSNRINLGEVEMSSLFRIESTSERPKSPWRSLVLDMTPFGHRNAKGALRNSEARPSVCFTRLVVYRPRLQRSGVAECVGVSDAQGPGA